MSKRRIQIGVIGGRNASPEHLTLAEEAGRLIAEQEAILVCGGLGGVMEAACRGAKSAGGITVGVLPSASVEERNPWVDIALPTGMGIARNALVVHASDGVVAVGGAYGTLSEMAFAKQEGKPLISCKGWVFDQTVAVAEDATEAVEYVFAEIKKLQ